MAEAFLPNPDNLPYVHHIDGNRLNNKLENLRWVSKPENNQESKLSRTQEKQSQEDIKGEEWRYFKDTIYQVSNKGRVKNTKTGRKTYGSKAECGYRRFTIYFKNGKKNIFSSINLFMNALYLLILIKLTTSMVIKWIIV